MHASSLECKPHIEMAWFAVCVMQRETSGKLFSMQQNVLLRTNLCFSHPVRSAVSVSDSCSDLLDRFLMSEQWRPKKDQQARAVKPNIVTQLLSEREQVDIAVAHAKIGRECRVTCVTGIVSWPQFGQTIWSWRHMKHCQFFIHRTVRKHRITVIQKDRGFRAIVSRNGFFSDTVADRISVTICISALRIVLTNVSCDNNNVSSSSDVVLGVLCMCFVLRSGGNSLGLVIYTSHVLERLLSIICP